MIGLGVVWGLWRGLDRSEEHGALMAFALTACGVLVPVALALLGADYLAPRNLVAAMIPLSACLAVVIGARRAGTLGLVCAGLLSLLFLAISIDVNLSPRLQRGDWRGVAAVLAHGQQDRVITTVELGSAPLEYYLPGLRNLAIGTTIRVSEIDETGYAPLRPGAALPPAPGFQLSSSHDIKGLILYRFVSSIPLEVSEAQLRRHVITLAHPEVLVPAHP